MKQEEKQQKVHLSTDLNDNLIEMRARLDNTADFMVRDLYINDIRVSFVMIEGMVSLTILANLIVRPLLNEKFPQNAAPEDIYDFIEKQTVMAADMKDVFLFDEVFKMAMSGFVVIIIDGIARGIALGAQGFNFRSISEPSSEVNERGSREGFTEPIKINLTMVRRRIKSDKLKFESFQLGEQSKTDACLIYKTDVVSQELLREIRRRLQEIKLDVVLDTGYLQPFLEGKALSLFSEVGVTERPDTLVAKILEGRVAIMLDGTPYVLIVPYLFSENFQSFDDYAHRPYFATFIRLLKYSSFLFTIYLPGLYVALATFHPEALPHALLFNIASAEETTPFPLMLSALIIHFIYEIMREAGLRLPRPVGHAVGIVGALVIGDAAVTAGLIGSPMVMVVALTAISSFVVPSLYEPVAVLRFLFIVIGGLTGLYGMTIASAVLLCNACRLNNFGVPFTSPISPFSPKAMRDVFVRSSWKVLQKSTHTVQKLRGSRLGK